MLFQFHPVTAPRSAAAAAIRESTRLGNLPPYVFAELDRLKAERVALGQDIIDLGMGNPDVPTPPHVVEKIVEATDALQRVDDELTAVYARWEELEALE